jgi:hypothetical protein
MNRFCGRTERNPALSCGEWAADSQVILISVDTRAICHPRTSGGLSIENDGRGCTCITDESFTMEQREAELAVRCEPEPGPLTDGIVGIRGSWLLPARP